jgi:hypothetical protein
MVFFIKGFLGSRLWAPTRLANFSASEESPIEDLDVRLPTSIENNRIPIKMTDVKNEATRGPHGPLHDQRSRRKKSKDGVECFFKKK